MKNRNFTLAMKNNELDVIFYNQKQHPALNAVMSNQSGLDDLLEWKMDTNAHKCMNVE